MSGGQWGLCTNLLIGWDRQTESPTLRILRGAQLYSLGRPSQRRRANGPFFIWCEGRTSNHSGVSVFKESQSYTPPYYAGCVMVSLRLRSLVPIAGPMHVVSVVDATPVKPLVLVSGCIIGCVCSSGKCGAWCGEVIWPLQEREKEKEGGEK